MFGRKFLEYHLFTPCSIRENSQKWPVSTSPFFFTLLALISIYPLHPPRKMSRKLIRIFFLPRRVVPENTQPRVISHENWKLSLPDPQCVSHPLTRRSFKPRTLFRSTYHPQSLIDTIIFIPRVSFSRRLPSPRSFYKEITTSC
ncbi:hypothetical protein CDAR_420681 [Caerostris darwini]|uniref:Uncharacterized protein n=1 Tax=Caerostris darwini TaxID=1538125 RepID=A0AAV4QSR9_9ARAC|nr:hypothetical protein CDAR_420681 [Caerostris darwini]